MTLGFKPVFILVGVKNRNDQYILYDSVHNLYMYVNYSSGSGFGDGGNSGKTYFIIDNNGFRQTAFNNCVYFAFG